MRTAIKAQLEQPILAQLKTEAEESDDSIERSKYEDDLAFDATPSEQEEYRIQQRLQIMPDPLE
jgi:hypothetical protein